MNNTHYIIRVGKNTENFEHSKDIFTWGFSYKGSGTICKKMKKGDILWFVTNKEYSHKGKKYVDGCKFIAVVEFDRYYLEEDRMKYIWNGGFYPHRIIFKNMYILYDKNIKPQYNIQGTTSILYYNSVEKYIGDCNLEQHYEGLKRYGTIYKPKNTNRKLTKKIKLVIKENKELKEENKKLKEENKELKEERKLEEFFYHREERNPLID